MPSCGLEGTSFLANVKENSLSWNISLTWTTAQGLYLPDTQICRSSEWSSEAWNPRSAPRRRVIDRTAPKGPIKRALLPAAWSNLGRNQGCNLCGLYYKEAPSGSPGRDGEGASATVRVSGRVRRPFQAVGPSCLPRAQGAGAYVVVPGANCVLSSSNNWKYAALLHIHYSVNISDAFVLHTINVSFNELTMPVTMSILQRQDVEKLVLEERAGQPKLNRTHEVQMYNTAGSSIGIWGSMVVVMLVILLLRPNLPPICNPGAKSSNKGFGQSPTGKRPG